MSKNYREADAAQRRLRVKLGSDSPDKDRDEFRLINSCASDNSLDRIKFRPGARYRNQGEPANLGSAAEGHKNEKSPSDPSVDIARDDSRIEICSRSSRSVRSPFREGEARNFQVQLELHSSSTKKNEIAQFSG
ncbi:hypothetical protein TKK_0005477 [Trichogramma kaykai]